MNKPTTAILEFIFISDENILQRLYCYIVVKDKSMFEPCIHFRVIPF